MKHNKLTNKSTTKSAKKSTVKHGLSQSLKKPISKPSKNSCNYKTQPVKTSPLCAIICSRARSRPRSILKILRLVMRFWWSLGLIRVGLMWRLRSLSWRRILRLISLRSWSRCNCKVNNRSLFRSVLCQVGRLRICAMRLKRFLVSLRSRKTAALHSSTIWSRRHSSTLTGKNTLPPLWKKVKLTEEPFMPKKVVKN